MAKKLNPKKIKEIKKEIKLEFVMMTNKELTEEFVKFDLEGRRGVGDPSLDYRVINGETYKLKRRIK